MKSRPAAMAMPRIVVIFVIVTCVPDAAMLAAVVLLSVASMPFDALNIFIELPDVEFLGRFYERSGFR